MLVADLDKTLNYTHTRDDERTFTAFTIWFMTSGDNYNNNHNHTAGRQCPECNDKWANILSWNEKQNPKETQCKFSHDTDSQVLGGTLNLTETDKSCFCNVAALLLKDWNNTRGRSFIF